VKFTVTPPNVSVHGRKPLKLPEVTVLLTFTMVRGMERIVPIPLKVTFGVRVRPPPAALRIEESMAIGPTVTAVHVTE
jgi:hypothetical protein